MTRQQFVLFGALFLTSAILGLSGCSSSSGDGATAKTEPSTPTATAPSKANDKEGTLDPDTLVVSLLPDQDAGTVIKNNEGLKKYLEGKLGKKIELTVLTNYAAMIEDVRQGHAHLAFFGPASYIKAKDLCQIEPFAALINKGKPTYYSVLVTNPAAGIKTVADAKGKKVALGDKLSTSSSYAPRALLYDAGLVEGRDYEPQYLGKHDAVAMAVQNGNADVGGMGKEYYEDMVATKKIDGEKVKILATSEELVEYPWVVQKSLKPELQEKIKKAFWELKDPEVLQYLKKAEGFAPVTDESYNAVRKVVQKVDKMEADQKASTK